jgi:hypothetical protein
MILVYADSTIVNKKKSNVWEIFYCIQFFLDISLHIV